MCKALRKHEDGHSAVFEKGVSDLEERLKSLETAMHSEIDTVFNEALVDIQSERDSYDAKTRPSQSEGVELTITEECESK
jgi:Bacterial protein of unknown function (DUF922)